MPNKEPNVTHQDSVIIIEQHNEPAYMALKRNGRIDYYRLRPATWQDHVEMHQCNVPSK